MLFAVRERTVCARNYSEAAAVVGGLVVCCLVVGCLVVGGFVAGAFVVGGFVAGAFVVGGFVAGACVCTAAVVTGGASVRIRACAVVRSPLNVVTRPVARVASETVGSVFLVFAVVVLTEVLEPELVGTGSILALYHISGYSGSGFLTAKSVSTLGSSPSRTLRAITISRAS